MNLLDFIKSKTIKNFLRNCEWKFDSADAAYVINQSMQHTRIDKLAAWQEVLCNMEDCEYENSVNLHKFSIHQSLPVFINLQEKLLDMFFSKDDNAVYTCNAGVIVSDNDILSDDPFYMCNVYRDFELCFKENANKKAYPLCIRKHYLKTDESGKDSQSIWVDFSKNKEVIDVGSVNVLSYVEEVIVDSIIFMKTNIPLPFQHGDWLYIEDKNKKLISVVYNRACRPRNFLELEE